MNQIIERFRKYFNLTEVVDKQTAAKYGDKAWGFFDLRLLEVLLWIRENLGQPLVINTTTQQQRGLRTNLSPLVVNKSKANQLYLSAHVLGKGVDFNVAGNRLSPNHVRQWIRDHLPECPHPIRLEDDKSAPTWVHIDVCNTTDQKLVEFSV